MTESSIEHKPNYWQNKIAAWMNESPIKVFDIENRDEITDYIREVFSGLNFAADKKLVSVADHIASGLTRAALPPDPGKLNEIILKHPLVKGKSIAFDISSYNIETLKNDVKRQLEDDLANLTKEENLEPEEKARKIFNYLFFAFNKQLRKQNVGGLGAVWDIIPADTRMPDHPMWHHFGLTSAIYSSLERNDNKTDGNDGKAKENLCMVVYSITPVQDFIGKARKLRDYWTGSVLLSYLAFEGITCVVDELGPDHIVYPSLHNQALMESWLSKKDVILGEYLEEKSVLRDLDKNSKSIASFPNKFVFICNRSDAGTVCKAIESKIDSSWKNTAEIVKKYVASKTHSEDNEHFNFVWDNAIDKYWKYSWAAVNFATINNEKELKKLLPVEKWENELDSMSRFNRTLICHYDVSNLYGTTHSLVQGLLAAGKNKPIRANIRNTQHGEKCPLCGENEVLNSSQQDLTAFDYKKNINRFWDNLRNKENSGDSFSQVGKNERLCAVCAVKRFLPLALRNDTDHLLYSTLVLPYKDEKFPSTTEMSAWEFLQTRSKEERKDIAEKLHDHEFDTNDEYLGQVLQDSKKYETKYYAFLLMDGDKMGDLINGETTEASWDDVLNVNKENSPFSDDNFSGRKRTINPALHSMISDSLNNFARYGVQPNVNRSGGRLIYAGGDDVCAILPLSKAFEVADSIRQVYQLSYAKVTDDGSKSLVSGEQKGVTNDEIPAPEMEKIVMHLGHTDNQDKTKISLSGAIIIAHHKQPLKEVIADAHRVLDGVAKNKSGRNSLAIRLKKRSGGDRDTWFKWEEENMFANDGRTCRESFLNVVAAAKEKDLSASLLYKLEDLRGALEPLSENIESNKEKILKLIRYEVEHSGFKNDNPDELSVDLAGICVKRNRKSASDTEWYNPEAAIIANFIAQKEKKTVKQEQSDGGDDVSK